MRNPKFVLNEHDILVSSEQINSPDRSWIYQNSTYKTEDIKNIKEKLKRWGHSTIVCSGSYKLLFYNTGTYSSNLLHGKMFYPGDGMAASSSNVINCTHMHVVAENGQFDRTDPCTMDNYQGMGKQEPHYFCPMEINSKIICVINDDPFTSGSAHVVDWTYLNTNESTIIDAIPNYYYTVGYGKITVEGQEKTIKEWIRVNESKQIMVTAIEPTVFLTFEEEIFS